MNRERLPPLIIGEYKLEYPILQGGMGIGGSGPELATEVSKNGGGGTVAGPRRSASRTAGGPGQEADLYIAS